MIMKKNNSFETKDFDEAFICPECNKLMFPWQRCAGKVLENTLVTYCMDCDITRIVECVYPELPEDYKIEHYPYKYIVNEMINND